MPEISTASKFNEVLMAAGCEYSGLSCNGVNLFGDKPSIDKAGEWMHRAAQRDLYADRASECEAENARLREALTAIAGFGDVNLSGEWDHGLRDIIRSMVDCARVALIPHEREPHNG